MNIKGTIVELMPEQTFGKTRKRELVIETQDKWPQLIKLEVINDKLPILDGLRIGEEVDVSFDIKGRKWKESYFVNLQAWKIVRGDESAQDPAPDDINQDAGDDDIPF
jgi:single-strand DNA-binding protein